MSNQNFRGKLSVAAAFAATLTLTGYCPSQAQTVADATATPAVTSTTTTLTPVPDVAPGVWTDPKYAIKEAPVKTLSKTTTTTTTTKDPVKATETTSTSTSTTGATTTVTKVYDEAGAKAFADSVSMPQYLWTRREVETKGQKIVAVNTSKEMAAFNRGIAEKFSSSLIIPNSATLVESTTPNYVYLFSFTIDAKGKITHINNENSFANIKAVNMADPNENGAFVSAISSAIGHCAPALPPADVKAPVYMILRYEASSGKTYVANLNTI
jgi:hypothetical protein